MQRIETCFFRWKMNFHSQNEFQPVLDFHSIRNWFIHLSENDWFLHSVNSVSNDIDLRSMTIFFQIVAVFHCRKKWFSSVLIRILLWLLKRFVWNGEQNRIFIFAVLFIWHLFSSILSQPLIVIIVRALTIFHHTLVNTRKWLVVSNKIIG